VTRASDTAEYTAFVRRILKAHAKRTADADPEDLADLVGLLGDVNRAMDTAVKGLRDSGFSWAQIAAATGTTRQAAHARWASRVL